MAKQVTEMKLKVDLQCEKCYKKVKKVLCKFPQIRDQSYDEKKDTVTIKVVCCSPEKLRDKLCCQGGGSIKSIEIVEPPKPKPEPEKPKPPPPKPIERPPPPPPPPEKPGDPAPRIVIVTSKNSDESQKQNAAAAPPPPTPVSILAYPSPSAPVGLFYEGDPSGPPGFYGRPIYDSYGGSGPCYVGCHQQHLWEEDASVCTIT